MSADRRYTSQARPEHLPALEGVELAAENVLLAYRWRAAAMRLAVRHGASLENIGRAAGLTRERVRQIVEADDVSAGESAGAAPA